MSDLRSDRTFGVVVVECFLLGLAAIALGFAAWVALHPAQYYGPDVYVLDRVTPAAPLVFAAGMMALACCFELIRRRTITNSRREAVALQKLSGKSLFFLGKHLFIARELRDLADRHGAQFVPLSSSPSSWPPNAMVVWHVAQETSLEIAAHLPSIPIPVLLLAPRRREAEMRPFLHRRLTALLTYPLRRVNICREIESMLKAAT